MTNWNGSTIKRRDGIESSFSLRKNPPRVEIYDEKAIPGKFIDYEPKFDKRAIAEALDRGEEVPGARFAQESSSLAIR